ncbi:7823_t:CDS:2, partial [Dentiscutata heterogama]
PDYEKEETYNTYLNLIYGLQNKSDNKETEESDSSTSEEDEILSGVQIATILNSQFKDFKWDDTNVYSQPTTPVHNYTDDNNNFFKVLKYKELGNSFSIKENEVSRYIRLWQIDINQDPLK